MKRTSWSQGLSVAADGSGVVPLAGSAAVRLLADRAGLTESLSTALARRGFAPGHDRGQVWVGVAVMLTAGGEAIADIEALRHQSRLFGPVASPPTVWRVLNEATPAALKRVEEARALTRRRTGADPPPRVEPAAERAGVQGRRHRSGGDGRARRGRHVGVCSFTCAWHMFLGCEPAATWEVGLIRRVAILLVDRRFVRCRLNITGARKACGGQRSVSGAAGWVGGARAAEPCR